MSRKPSGSKELMTVETGQTYDLIVVGSGIAGLFGGLAAAREGRVLVLSKAPVRDSSSYLAQGGLAAATRPGDSPALHAEDTMRAGRGPEWRQSEDMGPTARHRIQMKSYAELGAQVATA